MTDKDLRRLSRAELLDILYEQRKRYEDSLAENQALRQQLEDRTLRIASAGSIAEAAIQVNGVFEAAQAAADQYLASVKAATAEMMQKTDEAQRQRETILQDAKQQADKIVQDAQAQADKILFTGMIDEFYDYCYGELEYRSLRFETEVLDMGNYQGNAVVNYTDYEVPYTRIIEHKHFEFGTQPKTVITREYPAAWEKGKEPYYPINDPKNDELFDKYERRALEEKNVLFGGRLGMYRYMDMDKVIEEALNMAETELAYEEV